jgi:hypothetical protein
MVTSSILAIANGRLAGAYAIVAGVGVPLDVT